MVQWINNSPGKPGIVGLILSFTSPSDKTLSYGPYDLSCWWDVKRKQTNKNYQKFHLEFEKDQQAIKCHEKNSSMQKLIY